MVRGVPLVGDPRLWDLHVWRTGPGSNVPTISILHPGAAQGFPPNDPFPPGTFFFPARDP